MSHQRAAALVTDTWLSSSRADCPRLRSGGMSGLDGLHLDDPPVAAQPARQLPREDTAYHGAPAALSAATLPTSSTGEPRALRAQELTAHASMLACLHLPQTCTAQRAAVYPGSHTYFTRALCACLQQAAVVLTRWQARCCSHMHACCARRQAIAARACECPPGQRGVQEPAPALDSKQPMRSQDPSSTTAEFVNPSTQISPPAGLCRPATAACACECGPGQHGVQEPASLCA